MTRLVEFASESLLCHAEHLASLPEWFIAARRTLRIGGIIAFDVTDDACAVDKLRPHAVDSLPRILDRFYLWTPACSPNGRQLLLDALFGLTASNFSELIHPHQNRDNIHCLGGAIAQHCANLNNIRVLDFGCGPGFSVEVLAHHSIELIGYDRCAKMRSMAAKRGLHAVTPEEFGALPAQTFDAVFASYVFHLMPAHEDLRKIWEILRPNGIIVANFHKHCGVAEHLTFFSRFGAQVQRLNGLRSRFRHGSYWSYVRP